MLPVLLHGVRYDRGHCAAMVYGRVTSRDPHQDLVRRLVADSGENMFYFSDFDGEKYVNGGPRYFPGAVGLSPHDFRQLSPVERDKSCEDPPPLGGLHLDKSVGRCKKFSWIRTRTGVYVPAAADDIIIITEQSEFWRFMSHH